MLFYKIQPKLWVEKGNENNEIKDGLYYVALYDKASLEITMTRELILHILKFHLDRPFRNNCSQAVQYRI